jgi:lysophospholipase L1-like esterase
MKTVLCFGDSNTFGTAPMAALGEERRFGPAERWPGVLQAELGVAWRVIEEGLPGRTIGRDDPIEGADRNALRYLPACLQSHRPLDAVVFMLGTNDMKARFGVDAEAIAQGVHGLLDAVVAGTRPEAAPPRVLVVCPPPIVEVGCLATMFSGGAARSSGLGAAMARVAASRRVAFLDAGSLIAVSGVDGIHLDAAAQRSLGLAVAQALRQAAA